MLRVYPKLTPQDLKVSDVTELTVWIALFSKDKSLQEFVRGLLQGLGKCLIL
jgi:hypothetical protein